MADYFPLLARALDTMSDRSDDMRQVVYDRARAALITQLRSLEPPLGEAEIERERLALEDAVVRAEATYGAEAATPEPEPPDTATPAEPEPAAEIGRRPRLDSQPAIRRGGSRNRPLALAVGLVVVMVPVGILGWMWRDRPAPQPQEVARVEPARPAAPTDTKLADRIGTPASPAPRAAVPATPAPSAPVASAPVISAPNAPAAAPPAPASAPAPTEPASPAPTPTPAPAAPVQATAPATAPAQPELAVAQRAALIQENTADPQQPKITGGRTLWRIDALNGGQGQPLETVVRASVEVPDAGMAMTMVLRRNTDATFPASHTIELTFAPTSGTDQNRVVRDVGLPQLKPDDTERGVPLAGLSVPVKENIFLVGLSDLRSDIERNSDLLLHRNLIDIPIRFASGQRAVLSFEKGVSGDRVIAEAFRQWSPAQ